MTTIHRHFAIAAALVALTACSGSDAAPPPLDTEAPTTTVEATEPSVPATATETTTTAGTTSPSTTTTVAPTAPTDPAPTDQATLLAEIEADLNATEQAFLEAGKTPGSAESIATIEERYAGDARTNLLAFFDDLSERGLQVVASPTQPSLIEVAEIVEVSTDGLVSIRECRIDAAIIQRPPDDEFPDGVIVNDEVVRYINAVVVEFDGTRWRSTGGEVVEESQLTETADSCVGA